MSAFLPYGRHLIGEDDIAAVVEVLRGDWLTTGPKVAEFEQAVCAFTGAAYGVAVANGTAALHAAMAALGVGPGDEVVVPPMTFAASANCVLYQGATPVFADVDPDTLLIDPACAEAAITPRTKAVIGVDFAGQPCDWDALTDIARRRGVALVADACHSLGGSLGGRMAGSLADISVFSFHPVKHITTGEGGMCVCRDENLAQAMRVFRNHGITTDFRAREKAMSWHYDMVSLGYNYRITDIQCALGLSQLPKLPGWIVKRNELAALYDRAFAGTDVVPLTRREGLVHAYHLYVVRLPGRDEAFKRLREQGIGCNVHYIPVHLHPYYRERLGTGEGLCPVAEAAFQEILTLPLWPGMDEADVDRTTRLLLS